MSATMNGAGREGNGQWAMGNGERATGNAPSTQHPARGTEHPEIVLPEELDRPESRVYIGDCRDVLAELSHTGKQRDSEPAKQGALSRCPPVSLSRCPVDLIFADPPFNWKRAYDKWDDDLPDEEYLGFTYAWLDACVEMLAPRGSMWVNIPDDWAAEIVVHLKGRGLHMVNWCIWHYRFGQNTSRRFISSKVHALYFARDRADRTWNPGEVLEVSDRRAIYMDPRTENKRDGMPAGLRVPMDVWYGQYWGRIQGNNKERRHAHDNQLPEVYLARVIRACSNPGDLVLDPFLGSGTTGVIARWLGRRFIGVEYSAENARRAVERMKAEPLRLGVGGVGGEPHASTAIFPRRRKTRA